MSRQSDPGDEEFVRQLASVVGHSMQQLADALNAFVGAPSDQSALRVLQEHPELQSGAARQMIRGSIEDARNQGYIKEADSMTRRLALLESHQ